MRQRKGLIPKDVAFLMVEDPKPNIGSGSATLNAMLRVAEYLAAREGMTVTIALRVWHGRGMTVLSLQVVSEDTLCSFHILILHMGRTTFPFCPCGHGFMPHPSPAPSAQRTETWTNFDQLMLFLDRLCAGTPPGVWVASTDMLLTSINGISGELVCVCVWRELCCALFRVSISLLCGGHHLGDGVVPPRACHTAWCLPTHGDSKPHPPPTTPLL